LAVAVAPVVPVVRVLVAPVPQVVAVELVVLAGRRRRPSSLSATPLQ
jgi:hypothetical protein